jgi:hypothetical protein
MLREYQQGTIVKQKDIIRMAREAGFSGFDGTVHAMFQLESFAFLVAAAEREACAKVCDEWPNGREDVYSIGVAIRARGKK